jgi:hypothetical protein
MIERIFQRLPNKKAYYARQGDFSPKCRFYYVDAGWGGWNDHRQDEVLPLPAV